MNHVTWACWFGGLVFGTLLGFCVGVMRRPLGDSALALECDQQRKRAWAAEDKLRELAKILKTKEGKSDG